MSILKIEAFSGLSGDMFLGALAALCDGYEEIKDLPSKLHIEKEAAVEIRELNKKGIQCRHIKIIDKNNISNPDHGHKHEHSHDHLHKHAHEHTHEHDHKHEHHHGKAHHRHLKHINQIIDGGDISEGAKTIAKKIFLLLGEAESTVHGVPIEKIHFHEVGAIDSILDIVGSAVLLDRLNISQSYCTPVNTGFGFANTEHGRLPVPCPATQNLLLGMPTTRGEIESEMTTPTGAAILKYLNPDFNIPVLIDEKIGYGPGEKDFPIPNLLRLSLCKTGSRGEKIIVMQTNIDDMSAEYLGVEFQEKLFDIGALDIYYEQVIMKRGRPGVVLNVLAKREKVDEIADCIFLNTTSIGIRYHEADRFELAREVREVKTRFGIVKVKETTLPGDLKRIKPESRDILDISDRENKSSIDIVNEIFKNDKNEYN